MDATTDTSRIESELSTVKSLLMDIGRKLNAKPVATHAWISAAECAAMMSYTTKYFKEHIEKRKGFPRPSFPSGQPRWRLREIEEWMEKQRPESYASVVA